MKKEILTKEHLLVNKNKVTAIGDINNKDGYQKTKVSIKFLEKAIKFLKEYCNDGHGNQLENIIIFVKTDHPVQIGKKDIGYIISPIVER